jgi:Phasin protein
MSSAAEQFNAIYKANLDAARQYATMSVEGAERMLQLPIEATREFVIKGSDQFTTMWLDTSLFKALADWPALYQDNMQKAMDVARTYLETATKAQSELARFIQEQAAITNKSLLEGVQALANAASAESEIAASAIAASAIRPAAELAEHKHKKAAV